MLIISLMLALMIVPHSAPAVKAQPSGVYFEFDVWHATSTGTEEIEIELYSPAAHTITNQNMYPWSEIEWCKSTAFDGNQFFWGPDAYVVDGQDDNYYGSNPMGTGAITVAGSGGIFAVSGALLGHDVANGVFARLVVSVVYNSNTGAWNGAVRLDMYGTIYHDSSKFSNSDSGYWYPNGNAAWSITMTPSSTRGWETNIYVGNGGFT
jgi:hypothetical protein